MDELLALQARVTRIPESEDAYDAYSEAFGWIDRKSRESEVVDAFAWQLDEGDVLAYREEPDGSVVPIRNGMEYRVPLTRTGSDRYVMILSLAEILRDRYAVFVEAEGAAGSDTHGVLVLPHAQVAEQERAHPSWIGEHLAPLAGVDGFSGVAVPYYGHEEAAPEFSRQRARLEHRAERARAEMAQRIETAISGNAAGVRWAAAERALAQRMAQRQAGAVHAFVAVAFGAAVLGGWWTMPTGTAMAWLGLFAGAVAYHARVASRMKQGWRPGVAWRWLPLGMMVALALLAPGGLPPLPGRG
jgi:hypothetical protein